MCSGEKNKNIKSVLLSVYEPVTPALFVSSCISSLACLHLLHRQNKWIHPIIQFTFFFFLKSHLHKQIQSGKHRCKRSFSNLQKNDKLHLNIIRL